MKILCCEDAPMHRNGAVRRNIKGNEVGYCDAIAIALIAYLYISSVYKISQKISLDIMLQLHYI